MKTIRKALFFFLTYMIIIIFSSCFSEWKGDGATLTISFGGGNGRAAAWPPKEAGILGELDYTVTLSNGVDVKEFPAKGNETITTEVTPGLWNVNIVAKIDEFLFAEGSNSVDVIAGQNNHVEVPMEEKKEFPFLAVASADDWKEAVSSIGGGGEGKSYVIIVAKSFDMEVESPSITFGNVKNINVIIRGNHTITMKSGSGSLLNIWPAQNVTLRDVKLQGYEDSNNSPLVMVEGEGSNFTMEGSASVTGNTNNGGNGGGVGVYANGTFTMKDSAVISGNILTEKNVYEGIIGGNGGGVYVYNGKFTMMDSAVISGNTVAVNIENKGYGGGVYIENGTFTMSGSAVISGNKATGTSGSGNGGGVYVFNGTFTMSGGTIGGDEANTAYIGGGVYVLDGTFNMSGSAVISGNTATGTSGGGVFVNGSNSTFTMSDSYVSGNTGGGVLVADDAKFIMNSGYVSDNFGSGVRITGGVNFNATFTMNGGTISGNTTDISGGGVNVSSGTFTMSGGTISGNTAKGPNGGGVYVSGTYAQFHIVTGTVYGSDASENLRNNASTGAALCVENNGTAQRGTFATPGDVNSTWIPSEVLSTTNNTITVYKGEKSP